MPEEGSGQNCLGGISSVSVRFFFRTWSNSGGGATRKKESYGILWSVDERNDGILRIGCEELILEYSKLSSRDGILEAIKL